MDPVSSKMNVDVTVVGDVQRSSPAPMTLLSTASNCSTSSEYSRTSSQDCVMIVAAAGDAAAFEGAHAPPRRILGRNVNNTYFPTLVPSNHAELQLFRVLQAASLLNYFDTMLEMGGDDVYQLCDAGEDEFLEIMSLVGMAAKPLHVRRLQKALHEFLLSRPDGNDGNDGNDGEAAAAATAAAAAGPPHNRYLVPLSVGVDFELVDAAPQAPTLAMHAAPTSGVGAVAAKSKLTASTVIARTARQCQVVVIDSAMSDQVPYSPPSSSMVATICEPSPATSHSSTPPPSQQPLAASVHKLTMPTPASSPMACVVSSETSTTTPPPPPPPLGSSPCASVAGMPPPVLLNSQILRIEAAARRLSRTLQNCEPKHPNTKRKITRDIEMILLMCETDMRRMDMIRRYSAIYGRFDCKRRPEKLLTLHEVSVNEAAAQICRFVPALLTRREDLFRLARQVVKDAGCHFAKIPAMYDRDGSAPQSVSNSRSPCSIDSPTRSQSPSSYQQHAGNGGASRLATSLATSNVKRMRADSDDISDTDEPQPAQQRPGDEAPTRTMPSPKRIVTPTSSKKRDCISHSDSVE